MFWVVMLCEVICKFFIEVYQIHCVISSLYIVYYAIDVIFDRQDIFSRGGNVLYLVGTVTTDHPMNSFCLFLMWPIEANNVGVGRFFG